MPAPSFIIDRYGTGVTGTAATWREQFDRDGAIGISGAFAADYLGELTARAANTPFIDDYVDRIGSRAVESPQRVGSAVALMLHNPNLMQWMAQATGVEPIRAVAGRLVETRANGSDALAWHDDGGDDSRLLAVVINFSDRHFTGGRFELRRKGTAEPHFVFDHDQPGSMLVFAVRPDLEHRVTPVASGGPRRVFAGWFLSRPEHASGTLSSEIATR